MPFTAQQLLTLGKVLSLLQPPVSQLENANFKGPILEICTGIKQQSHSEDT